MQFHFFPQEFIELQREIITNHPALRDLLANQTDTDPELQFAKCIAEITAYCNIVLDDTYVEADLIKIADLCIWRLRAKAAPKIITSGGSSGSGNGVMDSPIIGLDGRPIVLH